MGLFSSERFYSRGGNWRCRPRLPCMDFFYSRRELYWEFFHLSHRDRINHLFHSLKFPEGFDPSRIQFSMDASVSPLYSRKHFVGVRFYKTQPLSIFFMSICCFVGSWLFYLVHHRK